MNQEYMNIGSDVSIVTDENGKIEKRMHNVSSNEVLTENKIEKILGELEKLNKKKDDCEGVIMCAKFMLKAQFVVVLFSSLIGFSVSRLYGLIYALLLCSVCCAVNSIIWGISSPIAKRRLKGTLAKIEKAEKLKKKFEKELIREKRAIIKDDIVMNEPISLKNKNNFEFAQINKDLDEAYHDAVCSKPKKRVLKREKKER